MSLPAIITIERGRPRTRGRARLAALRASSAKVVRRGGSHPHDRVGPGRRGASAPVPANPVGPIPVRRDPNPTNNHRRSHVDDRRWNSHDRGSDTDDNAWPPAAAMPVMVPPVMPSPARVMPPRGGRFRRQRGYGKRGDGSRTDGKSRARSDVLHVTFSQSMLLQPLRIPRHGRAWPGPESQRTEAAA